MEETIKGKEVIAYKGMEIDMTCKGFQYEVGKTYKTDKVKLCERGFHACLNPKNLFGYYSRKTKSRYFKVLISGEITKCGSFDTNVAATEITILEEIPSDKFLTNTEWWKNEIVLDLLYWSDGLARVKREDSLMNFIDKDGKLLSEEWFEWADDFFDGFALIQRKDTLYNLITTNGKILSEEWFDWINIFEYGFADVERTNGEQAKIDKNGKIVVRK